MAKAEKKYHHGSLRQCLIDESLKRLDAEQPDLSLRELAKACGVSSNAPYRHFKSKDELLANLATHGFELLHQRLAGRTAEGPVKQFREIGQAFASFASEYKGLFRIMFGHRLLPTQDLDEARSRCFDQLADSVRIVMGEVTATPDVKQKTLAAWSLLLGFGLINCTNAFPLDQLADPVAGSDVARTLARGLRD